MYKEAKQNYLVATEGFMELLKITTDDPKF